MHFENYARKNGLFRDVPDELWNDWHWQVKNRVETLEDLNRGRGGGGPKDPGQAPHGHHPLLSVPHRP